jgi:hypothetical protein
LTKQTSISRLKKGVCHMNNGYEIGVNEKNGQLVLQHNGVEKKDLAGVPKGVVRKLRRKLKKGGGRVTARIS